jgi:hypothetical protein
MPFASKYLKENIYVRTSFQKFSFSEGDVLQSGATTLSG